MEIEGTAFLWNYTCFKRGNFYNVNFINTIFWINLIFLKTIFYENAFNTIFESHIFPPFQSSIRHRKLFSYICVAIVWNVLELYLHRLYTCQGMREYFSKKSSIFTYRLLTGIKLLLCPLTEKTFYILYAHCSSAMLYTDFCL